MVNQLPCRAAPRFARRERSGRRASRGAARAAHAASFHGRRDVSARQASAGVCPSNAKWGRLWLQWSSHEAIARRAWRPPTGSSGQTASHFGDRHRRSMNRLPIRRPRPSMLIRTPAASRGRRHASLVNRLLCPGRCSRSTAPHGAPAPPQARSRRTPPPRCCPAPRTARTGSPSP